MGKSFERFPEGIKCPFCGTNEQKETVLIGIAGTEEGNIIQSKPTHLECLLDHSLFYPEFQLTSEATVPLVANSKHYNDE